MGSASLPPPLSCLALDPDEPVPSRFRGSLPASLALLSSVPRAAIALEVKSFPTSCFGMLSRPVGVSSSRSVFVSE